jgi:hypothetical protein
MGTTFLPILLQKYLSNPATKALSMSNFKITDLQTPTNNTDAATKLYVDNVAAGGGTSAGTLPFLLQRGTGVGAVTIGEFTNPSGDDLQLSAPTTTGRLIFNDIHGVDFNNSPLTQTTSTGTGIALTSTGNNNVLSIVKNPSNLSGHLITLNNTGNFTNGESAINIVHGTNAGSINIANTGTGGSLNITQTGAGHAIQINKASGTGSTPLIDVNNTGTSNIRLCDLTNTNASSTNDNLYLESNATDANAHCLEIQRPAGNGNNILSVSNSTNDNVVITNATTAGKALTINANQTNGSAGLEINKAGTGNAITIANTGSGNVANITSTGAGITFTHTNTGTQNMINLTRSGGTGGRLLNMTYSNSGSEDVIRVDRTNNTGNIINLISNTAGTNINSSQSGGGVNINATNTANSGSSNNVEFIKSGTGNGGNVFIRNNSSVGASTGIALSILNEGVADCLRISDEAGDTSLMRVDSDGRVGIGVSNGTLTNTFESNAVSGTASTKIEQSSSTITTTATDTPGTSRLLVNSSGVDIAGRSDIVLEPTRGTSATGTTPRIRMTVAAGSNNGILLQGNNATAGTQFRYGFTSGSTAESTLNIYSDTTTRRARLGQQDIYSAVPSGVLEITRNATPHGTTIPHILLNGTNASPSNIVMDCNLGIISRVADPVSSTDAANRQWVLSQVSTPTQIATGQNRYQTTAGGISQQADTGQSMNMGINNNGQKNIQSYSANVLINVPSGSTTNDNQVMEAWSSDTTGTYSTSSTFLSMAVKPRTNQLYVGRFTGADIQGIGPTTRGILQVIKNSGTHGVAPHLFFDGADSPYNPLTAVAINVNNKGKIVNVEPPSAAKDVLTANDVSNVNVSSGTIIKLCDYTQPLISTPMISRFSNTAGSFGISNTNPYGIYYLLNANAGTTSMGVTTGLYTCPISYNYLTTNITPSDTVGCFQLLKNGTYRINVNMQVGTVSGGSLGTDFINLTVYQNNLSGTFPPNIICPTSNQFYLGSFDRFRSLGHNLNISFTFLIRRTNGAYFTFGTDSAYGPLNWNGLNCETNRFELIAEYLGLDYV